MFPMNYFKKTTLPKNCIYTSDIDVNGCMNYFI